MISKDSRKLPVLASVENVAHFAVHTVFHPDRVGPAVDRWGRTGGPGAGMVWRHPCHFFDGTEETVRWIFILDILNHCFWPDKGAAPWTVDYRGRSYSGYLGLAACLKKAMEEGVPLTDSGFLADLKPEELRNVFAGQGEIPLFERRLFNLREAGAILRSRFGGDIADLVRAAQGSAAALVKAVVSHFPSFRDESVYRGERVHFWKRAQIFAADLHLAFDGLAWGRFHDIDELTAFADYKLPQVLRRFGVVSYSPELSRRIDSMDTIAAGCEEEVEIRAMTVLAVEAFKKAFLDVGSKFNAVQIDNWLWGLGQKDEFRDRPYHRCRTIYY